MSFLIDTNICSAYLKGDRRVFSRFIQHSGGIHISVISAGELYVWMHLKKTPQKYRVGLNDLLSQLIILHVDHDVAKRFGEVRAELLERGIAVPEMDMMIASTALLYDLTLVTHNVRDFTDVPGLRVVDWLAP